VKPLLFAIAATTIATTGRAQALQTTFTFSAADGGKSSLLKSVDGINMTLGSYSDPGPLSYADRDGIGLLSGSGFRNSYNSFAITFNQTVKLISYNLSWEQSTSGISTIFQQNLLQSIETYSAGTGSKSFNNQFIAQANVPILVTSNNNGDIGRLTQINSLTVEKQSLPASVPGPLPILGLGAAFGLSRRLRRRVSLSK
jgi:hypothetical protein